MVDLKSQTNQLQMKHSMICDERDKRYMNGNEWRVICDIYK